MAWVYEVAADTISIRTFCSLNSGEMLEPVVVTSAAIITDSTIEILEDKSELRQLANSSNCAASLVKTSLNYKVDGDQLSLTVPESESELIFIRQ